MQASPRQADLWGKQAKRFAQSQSGVEAAALQRLPVTRRMPQSTGGKEKSMNTGKWSEPTSGPTHRLCTMMPLETRQ